jgi:D-glycero-alpha-D-manno-heptose 1-phosphate guanylyltransferase
VTSAIILAGGLGTRLRSAVPDLPKPLAPISGRPFLAHQMDYWIAQGVDSFVLSVGYKKELIVEHFGASYNSVPITYAIEHEPMGTGGGLLLAAQRMYEPFLVLNGDTFFEVDLAELRSFHDAHQSEWTFTLFRPEESGRYLGLKVAPTGKIVSFDTGNDGPDQLANGGVYLMNPSVLARAGFEPGQKLSLENDLLPEFTAKGGSIHGIECHGRFIDIGVPRDYLRASKILPQ